MREEPMTHSEEILFSILLILSVVVFPLLYFWVCKKLLED